MGEVDHHKRCRSCLDNLHRDPSTGRWVHTHPNGLVCVDPDPSAR